MSLYAHVEHMDFGAFEKLNPATGRTYGADLWYL